METNMVVNELNNPTNRGSILEVSGSGDGSGTRSSNNAAEPTRSSIVDGPSSQRKFVRSGSYSEDAEPEEEYGDDFETRERRRREKLAKQAESRGVRTFARPLGTDCFLLFVCDLFCRASWGEFSFYRFATLRRHVGR